jgi:quinol-cytochrome oxidoreductase complex cytochrome b subunit/cytochrome c2
MGGREALAASGWALSIQFLVQVGLGVFLFTRYTPTLEGAHESVEAVRSSLGFLQNAHYWGSQLLIAHSFLHLAAMVWTGHFRAPYRAAFLGAILLFLAAFLFQVTGNLLPMDRHDVQTTGIEASIGSSVPVVGEQISTLMLGGKEFGQATLDSWLFAHRFIVTGLMTLGIVLALVGFGKSKYALWASLYSLILVALVAPFVNAPAGAAATQADYAEQATLVSWYTWPMHGALKASSSISPGLGWLGAAVLPGLFMGFLVLLPMLGKKISLAWARVGFALFVLLFLGLAIGFGGSFAPITGNQDPPKHEPAAVASAEPIDEELAKTGERLFKAELACAGCHGEDLSGGAGGPGLLKVYEKHPDAEWYKRFIKNPKSIRPGSTMSAFEDLSDRQLAALAEYLRKPK